MDILDIFYNSIVKEASIGKINCYFIYSILFKTNILDDNDLDKEDLDDYLYPTLTIHDKKVFDELLVKYVELCMFFYKTSDIPKEVINCELGSKEMICPEKYIMTLLWANATYDDFLNPEEFLRKRISFIENSKEIFINTEYSNMLNGYINFIIEKDHIMHETPYKIIIKFINENKEEYTFPEIKFGLYNDTVYIYAIQNFDVITNDYGKKINRLLYKIGEGFDSSKDNYELFKEGNLKDVSASFVVALNIAISYFHNLGYRKIEVPSILPIRYNSKNLVLERKTDLGKFSDEESLVYARKIEDIQKNLTEKFIRTFLRLNYHYEGMEITSLPFDIDSSLHLKMGDELITNNTLLKETGELINTRENVKNI